MKYLKIHTALWYIICLIAVVAKMICFAVASIFYFLWCFKRPRWRDFNDNKEMYPFRYDKAYEPDRNPIETFKRYFHMFDEL